ERASEDRARRADQESEDAEAQRQAGDRRPRYPAADRAAARRDRSASLDRLPRALDGHQDRDPRTGRLARQAVVERVDEAAHGPRDGAVRTGRLDDGM